DKLVNSRATCRWDTFPGRHVARDKSNGKARRGYVPGRHVARHSKKMMAVSSPPKAMGSSSLDMGRAESSRQHVRALNNQFASWVQTQLQNHPDELLEDRVRDYLTHTSNVMVAI
nr:cell wall protein DAN4 [Tanacetum cinerariifolium]